MFLISASKTLNILIKGIVSYSCRCVNQSQVFYMSSSVNHSQFSDEELSIRQCTKLSRDHLTPEIGLHLLDENSEIWIGDHEIIRNVNPLFQDDPFWAIYWPGGQALSRFILDHRMIVKNSRVLDLGSGCGAGAISAVLAGAKSVCANDIDPIALNATLLNAKSNNISLNRIDISEENFLMSKAGNSAFLSQNFDVILVGDMFFDEDIGAHLANLLMDIVKSQPGKKRVLVGDPGRWFLCDHSRPILQSLRCLAKYELVDATKKQNFGLTSGFVYDICPRLSSVNK